MIGLATATAQCEEPERHADGHNSQPHKRGERTAAIRCTLRWLVPGSWSRYARLPEERRLRTLPRLKVKSPAVDFTWGCVLGSPLHACHERRAGRIRRRELRNAHRPPRHHRALRRPLVGLRRNLGILVELSRYIARRHRPTSGHCRRTFLLVASHPPLVISLGTVVGGAVFVVLPEILRCRRQEPRIRLSGKLAPNAVSQAGVVSGRRALLA